MTADNSRRRYQWLRSLLSLGLVTMLASCGRADGDGGHAATRGVFDAEVDVYRVGATPEWVVGRTSPVLLDRVRGAVFVGSKVAIGNSGYHEVLILDKSGRLVAKQGREGLGPGEYRNVAGVFRGADGEVVVWDAAHQRLTYLDSLGRHVDDRNVRIEDHPGVMLLGLTSSTALFEYRRSGFPGEGPAGPATVRQDVSYVLLALDSLQPVARVMVPGPEMWMRREGGRGIHGGLGVIFGRDASAAVTSWAAVLGQTDSLSLRLFDGAGREEAALLSSGRPLSGKQWEPAVRDTLREFILGTRDRLGPQSEFLAQLERFRLDLLKDLPARDTLPAFSQLLGGSDDRLWVRAYPTPEDDLVTWVGLDRDLRPTKRLQLPAELQVTDIAEDRILARSNGRLGENLVLLYQLVPLANDGPS